MAKRVPMTEKEQQLLDALAGTGTRTPGDLIAEGRVPHGTSPGAWHQVAASAVRKGWAEREVLGGQAHYSITRAGRRALQARECPACADPPEGRDHTCGLKRLDRMLRLGTPR